MNALVNTPNVWTACISLLAHIAEIVANLALLQSYLYVNPPRYLLAFSVNLGSSVAALASVTAVYLYLRRANRRMEQGLSTGKSGPTETQIQNGYKYPL